MLWNCPASRRHILLGSAAAVATNVLAPAALHASGGIIRFGLTPVFLSNDLELLDRLRTFLARKTGADVVLVQRRTYEEITSLLVSGQLTAAWICGYPFVSYREELALVAVPVWRGRPLYRSYLIVDVGRRASSLDDLEGDVHAFSDPNSNSGYLVTRAALAKRQRRPDEFFRHSFFTYGHRNVVRAVASGLAQSGSVDGYVWEVVSEIEPELAGRTRVLERSELLGFPPVASPRHLQGSAEVLALKRALLEMNGDPLGAAVLRELRLDGFTDAETSVFDGIAEKLAIVRSLG